MKDAPIPIDTFQSAASALQRGGESSLYVTEDGSHTLFVPAIDECYHSTHGAVQESRHIFIQAGLKQCPKTEISVLEIGFGTGLNAFLAQIEAEQTGKKIAYTALEKFPVSVDKALKLNYPEEISPSGRKVFENLHTAPWNEWVGLTDTFTLIKIETDFTTFQFSGQYDVIFFDAFSPEKQPEMWTESLFSTLFARSNAGAILTTYCAKGVVRRAMQAAGYVVERLPGPPGKRQILRAIKPDLTLKI